MRALTIIVSPSQYYVLISHVLQRNYAFIAFILVSGSQLLSAHDVLINTLKLLAGFGTLGLGTLNENCIEGKCTSCQQDSYKIPSGFLLDTIRIPTRYQQDAYWIPSGFLLDVYQDINLT